MEQIAKENIRRSMHLAAMSARGQVIVGKVTEDEAMRYLAEIGNEEFKKVFSMSKKDVLMSMVALMLEHE